MTLRWKLRLMVFGCLLLLARPGWSAAFYVAPNGDDGAPGTRANPFATLERARDAVRALKAAGRLRGPVEVVLAPGTYYLSRTFELGPQDSRTAAAPITYRAAAGGAAVISGGRRITGWREVKPGLWAADVPAAKAGRWVFRQLFVNGARRTLARSPNRGYFRIAGRAAPTIDPKTGKEVSASKIAFRFKAGDIKPWPRLNEIDAVVLRNWESAMLPLKSVDMRTRTVTFAGPMKWSFKTLGRYYIENAPDALDAPGEWRLDRQAGVVYYRPLPGEDMTRAEAIAPALERLVRIQGEPEAGLFVSDVRFEGLSFQHAAYRLEPTGHSDWQAAVTVEAAVMADAAARVVMKRCEVKHVGGYGVWFRRGCSRVRIEQCETADCGAGGVRFGEARPRKGPLATHHNTLTNCYIHDTGHLHLGAVGVWIGQSSDNEITHNEICDTTYTGVSVGWSWGYRPTTCHRNHIEFNHIHHIVRGALFDSGAIYTLGLSDGTTIRNNLIHHVWGWTEVGGAGGIYPDEGSSGIRIENNVVYETQSGGLTMHYGRNDVVRNNIFAFGQAAQVHLGRQDKKSSLTFERNIIYFRQGALFRRMCELRADYNIYYSTSSEPIVFPGDRTFDQWKAAGYDRRSLLADPKFADPAHYDFRLRPDSPALKLGFQPIDLSKVGLYGDPEWVNKPKRVRRLEGPLPALMERPPRWIDDGFELTPVGATPDAAHVFGETEQAHIRVTDEVAASGRKCLKFTDAPGLRYSWNPHMFYMPHVKKGAVRLSFDLRFEPGARIWHEWRDAGHPYRVGPSLGVDARGELRAGRRALMTLPPNQWIRFEILWAAGGARTYELTVKAPGRPAKRFEDLPCDPRCKRVDWLGFVSNATDRRVFYLDNVKLAPAKR